MSLALYSPLLVMMAVSDYGKVGYCTAFTYSVQYDKLILTKRLNQSGLVVVNDFWMQYMCGCRCVFYVKI